MSPRKSVVSLHSASSTDVKPLRAKPLCEVSETIDVEGGADLYIALGNKRYQFKSQRSPFYEGTEYVVKVLLHKGDQITFVHKDGRKVPVHGSSDCGYTLVGKAKKLIEATKALCCNGEKSDDQEYVYINQNSVLHYTGEEEEHTLFLRVYDNIDGKYNDRWVVISID